MRWEKLQTRSKQEVGEGETSGPGKRWGHTCNAIKGGRFLSIFGGYGKDNCQTNQVHVFDTAKQTWSQPMIIGTLPIARDSHSCTTVGDNLFVFGGTDGKNPLKDLHILDTSSHTWICPSLRGEGPEAREGHSATLIDSRLFIFGGCGKSSDSNDEVYYNDLYILNTETFAWKCATTFGTPPSPRDSHTCSSWKNKIIVIGGEDRHDYYLSDVHILDADTMVWKELDTSGQILPPRAGHCTVAFGKNLFVFGGFTDAQSLYDDIYMLGVDTGIWTKLATTGNGPSARFSVAGDCLDPLKAGVLVFLGGCNKSLEALDDMYYLYTGLLRENERRPEKLSLRKQLKLKCQEQNITPIYNKPLVKTGTSPDMCQTMPVPDYSLSSRQNFLLNQFQPVQGKKTFQAKITENFPEGYAIETVIDGKPLRGIIFSNKPNPSVTANHNSSRRKRAAGEAGGVYSNGSHNSKSKSSRNAKQDPIDHSQSEGAHGKENLTFCDQPTEAAATSVSKNLKHSYASQPQEELSSRSSLNLEEDRVDDATNINAEVQNESISATTKDTVTVS